MDYTTDSELIERLKKLDPLDRSWDAFYLKYEPLLLRWCLRWGVPSSDTEEIIQETLLNLFRYIGTYRNQPGQRFRSWLKTVAYHTWIRIARNHPNNKIDESRDGIELEHLSRGEDLACVFERIADREILEIVCQRVSARVSEASWNCFRYRYFDDLSVAEVANRLNLTENAVYLNSFRLMRMLREEISSIDRT